MVGDWAPLRFACSPSGPFGRTNDSEQMYARITTAQIWAIVM